MALFPSKHDDRDGCFSGSAVEHEGKMYLFYTGVRYLAENPEDINLHLNQQLASAQMMVTSEDGIHFDNTGAKKTIIPPMEDRNIGDLTHTRDPKVWRGKDAWYMVLGTCSGDRKGRLLFYRSGDLEHWSYVNSASKDGFSRMWECPDYFETEEGGILSFSPMGFLKDGYHVEIYVDANLIEVFINDGEAVITNVVYGLSDRIKLAQGREAVLCTVK